MKIYIDSIFLINLVLNVFILILTAGTLKLSATKLRILLGGAVGALGYCLILFLPVTYAVKVWAGLIPVSILMCLFTFRSQGVKNILRQTGFLFIYAFLTGGAMLFLQRQFAVTGRYAQKIWLTLLLGYAVFAVFDHFLKSHRRQRENCFVKVSIPCGADEVKITALVDTGNGLTEPVNKKPVAILDEAAWERLRPLMKEEKTKAIPYHNIGNENGLLIGYEIEKIFIERSGQRKEYRQVIVAIGPGKMSGAGEYQMILNPMLMDF